MKITGDFLEDYSACKGGQSKFKQYFKNREATLEEIYEGLMYHYYVDIELAERFGWIAWLMAIHQSVAEELLSLGADVNIQGYNGWTALMFAIYEGRVEVVKFLLSVGADPTLENSSGLDSCGVSRLSRNTDLFKDILPFK